MWKALSKLDQNLVQMLNFKRVLSTKELKICSSESNLSHNNEQKVMDAHRPRKDVMVKETLCYYIVSLLVGTHLSTGIQLGNMLITER